MQCLLACADLIASLCSLFLVECIIFCNSVTRVELLAKKITELGSSQSPIPSALAVAVIA